MDAHLSLFFFQISKSRSIEVINRQYPQ